DYSQELTELTFGFYVPNAICTLQASSRSFQQKTSSEVVTDALTAYTFSTEIFKKNVPYRVRLWLAFQDLSRSYDSGSTTTATLDSVILGTQFELTLTGPLVLTAGLEGNLYSFGLGSLSGGDSDFLFRSYAGVKLNLDSNPLVSRFL
ncbi:MAG TPA: hypothetical protein VFI08_10870, partial [Spirochaetia bacterium]|nr:hypothetical protein [Spirochaetia bacterium]